MELMYALFIFLGSFLFIIGLRVVFSRKSGVLGDWLKKIFSPSSNTSTSLVATLVFTFIGLAIFLGSMYSSSWDTPTLARVVSWSREHWLWVILLFGILAAIVQVNTVTLGKATEVLHKTLMGTVFMLFIGFPVWMWLTTSSGGSSVRRETTLLCPDVSAYQTNSCIITAEWSNWIKFSDGPEDNGKNFCVFPMVQYTRENRDGTTFWRFKIADGQTEIRYRLFPAGGQCPTSIQ